MRPPPRPRWIRRARLAALALILAAAAPLPARAAPGAGGASITDTSVRWPTWAEFVRVVTLRDYNTRVVVAGVGCLGLAAGLIGSFMLLRERALLGDALSHATLPGIGLAFIVMAGLGGTGKSLPGLLLGATVSGVLGVLGILLIVHLTRIKEDTALGIVLSVFFGAGVAVNGIIQNMSTGHAAGLQAFIYGKTASMLFADALTIAIAGLVCALVCTLLFKEFALLCFDAGYARAQGWPVVLLDVVMMALVVGVTVIGLQAVGLILMIALLVIPPAAARFWTHHLPTMLAVSAMLGLLSCLVGAALSALVPRLPAGAVIVLVSGLCFVISMVFGGQRGMLVRSLAARSLNLKIRRQHLLRALHELIEAAHHKGEPPDWAHPVSFAALLAQRSWSPAELRRELRSAARDGLLRAGAAPGEYVLTSAGVQAAWRVARNHRLWELYLITHADIAPSHVDRDADEVEHVLGASMIAELEQLMVDQYPGLAAPLSPHRLEPALSAARVAAPGDGRMIPAPALTWLPLDTWMVLVGALCGVSCALLGTFLVLRRMSMMGDAISHAVLPGLAVAFLLTGRRDSFAMLAGAALVGVLTAVFTQWIHSAGKVERGAAMGVVFTILFALGLILIRQFADSVDLDPDCVLYGALEYVPLNTVTVWGWTVPRALLVVGGTCVLNGLCVLLLYKELKISSFDPALATTLGLNATVLHYLLMILVAITTVASFESVGSILVIAMLIVPPAAAHLLTERLSVMLLLAILIAAASAFVGHVGALVVPGWFGFEGVNTNTAGMMSVAVGLFFLAALLAAPRHGLLSKLFHRAGLALRIVSEDVLKLLFHTGEPGKTGPAPHSVPELARRIGAAPLRTRLALVRLRRAGQVVAVPAGYQLTAAGREAAQQLVRSHRLWETYFDQHVQIPPDHLHEPAERLEHATSADLRERLAGDLGHPTRDPHGTPIPPSAGEQTAG